MLGQAAEMKSIITGKDIVTYIIENGLYDAELLVGTEGYTSGEDLAIGYNGEFILVCDSCYYEGFCD